MVGSKEFFQEYQEQLLSNMDENDILGSFVNLYEQQKHLEKSISIIKDFTHENHDNIALEAQKYPEGFSGYDVIVRNGGKVFNYKGIDSIEKKEAELKELKEVHKQAFIAKEKNMLTATQDGEEIELPSITYRKSSISLKKQI